eukprot:TRINITY_DN67843_c0_g1_i1.p1 TRINITY_DN67843_c0_g1~~TRINITY_DN67843_c0_g1_i1.p1  ORF type:complete len:266 (+),score=62.02 TRINITY_DN67843_c0_g1_i1:103-798(+)
MAEGPPVVFLGLARIQDQAVLATCYDKSALSEEKRGLESALASVLERAGTAYPGWRERAECQGCSGAVHALADSQALCVVVAGVRDARYPDRVALQLLRDLAEKVHASQGAEVLSEAKPGALSSPLRKLMKEVMQSYAEAGNHDKTTEVREKVDQLKGIMQDNVKRILETHVTLDSLENSSSSMSSQANQFLRQSVDLKRQVQIRNLKIKVCVFICVIALILYFALPFIDI